LASPINTEFGMKLIATAALIASSFTPLATPLLVTAATAKPASNFCGVSSPQWTCDAQNASETYYSDAQTTASGGDIQVTCQDYVRTTADYVGINPAGRESSHFSNPDVTTDMPVGGPYDGTWSGCNYPPL
jgi:hypothetical protein